MKKLIMLKGLPGCGKSTKAKELVKDKKDWVRINNDDLGQMLFGDSFAEGKSHVIDSNRKLLITSAMEKRFNIVIDNTNLSPKHEEYLRELVATHNEQSEHAKDPELYEFEIIDLTSVPLKTCLTQNELRERPVPKKVILQMYRAFVEPTKKLMEQDSSKPKAIIVDIDGTVAKLNGRDPFNMKKCNEDLPVIPIIDIVKTYQAAGSKVIFVTGRDETVRQLTADWLHNVAGIKDYLLYMRPAGSKQPDVEFKKQIFDKHIKSNYFIQFVLEDRDRMVSLYREDIGLTCLQVAEGSF